MKQKTLLTLFLNVLIGCSQCYAINAMNITPVIAVYLSL